MAEALAALGVVASVAQLADYGFKLSIKLYAYSEAVHKADKSIRSFSNEVSLTSAVLKELSVILGAQENQCVSERALAATQTTVKECFVVFNQLNKILEKSMGVGAENGTDSSKLSTFDRLKWPFVQPKADLLRSNLDRLKASLTLMLQVLSFARDISKQSKTDSSTEVQKYMIESLAKSEREANERYQVLLKLLTNPKPSEGSRDPLPTEKPLLYINTSSHPVIPQHSPDTQAGTGPQVGDLLLCFELLSNVIRDHTKDALSQQDVQTYINLLDIVQQAQTDEYKRLEDRFGSAALRLLSNTTNDVVAMKALLLTLVSRYADQLSRNAPTSEEATTYSEIYQTPSDPDAPVSDPRTSINQGAENPLLAHAPASTSYSSVSPSHSTSSSSIPSQIRPKPSIRTSSDLKHTKQETVSPGQSRISSSKLSGAPGSSSSADPASFDKWLESELSSAGVLKKKRTSQLPTKQGVDEPSDAVVISVSVADATTYAFVEDSDEMADLGSQPVKTVDRVLPRSSQPQDIVQRLLAEWTTLPGNWDEKHSKGSNDSSDEDAEVLQPLEAIDVLEVPGHYPDSSPDASEADYIS